MPYPLGHKTLLFQTTLKWDANKLTLRDISQLGIASSIPQINEPQISLRVFDVLLIK